MKTICKRLLATLLSVLLMMVAVPLSVWPTITVSAASTASFSDGTAYEYTVTSGKATITKYTGTAVVVEIPDSLDGNPVTTIATSAFRNAAITTVVIPDTVITIGNYAFRFCSALKDLVLSKALTNMGYLAFANTAIESVEIPKSLDSCDRSSTFTYDFEGVTYNISGGPFFNCKELKSVTFEEGVTQIPKNLFAGAIALESVTIPNTVTVIEEGAFRDCLRLRDVIIGQTVATISDYAFYNCCSLSTLALPNSVTSLGNYAFRFCSALKDLVLSKALTDMGYLAFANTAIESVEIPKSLDSCGRYSFTYDFEGVTYDNIYGGPFFNCKELKSVTFEEGVTQIPKNLFAGAMALESVTIPNTVTVIEEGAFRDCLRLRDVIIGQAVVTISDYAFYRCLNLSSLVLPNSVTSLGNYAFRFCSALKDLVLSKALTDMGYLAFANTAIESVEIPKSLDSCGRYASFTYDFEGVTYDNIYGGPFFNCKELKSVTFEKGATQIPENLFAGAMALESVTIPNTVTVIENGAFRDCLRLRDVTIGLAVTTIGSYAFYRCVSLLEVDISRSVTTISDYAFYNCRSLSTLVLPNSVSGIGDCTFRFCSALKELVLSKSLTNMGYLAFANTAIESVEIPKSLDSCSRYSSFTYDFEGVTYDNIYGGPFFNCKELKSVTFEEGATQIPENLFAGTMALESVTIPNTVTVIESGAFRDCLRLREVDIPSGVAEVSSYAFYNCRSLLSVVLPDSITAMSDYCFAECSSMESVILPEKRVNIPSYAFYHCASLKTIDFPVTVENIRTHAFDGCSSLESFTFSNGSRLKTIENYAFRNCSSLREAILPETVVSIGEDAFRNNIGLIKVVIPQSTKTMGVNAFMGCEQLVDVQIADYSLTELPSRAFMDCSALMRIELPKGLTTVKSEAFRNTVELCEIVVPESVTSIDSTAISYPFRTTIYGIPGSYAETFSKTGEYTFVDYRIPMEGIALKDGLDTIIIDQGETYRAEFEVFPEGANEVITLKSNTSNITIQGHDLYGRNACDAVITATASGGMSCQFNLHVRSVKNIRVITLPDKMAYHLGETFDSTGMVVQVNYNDGSSRIVTDYTVLDFSSDIEGDCTVKVRWISANNGTYDHTFTVAVFDPTPKLTGIEIRVLPVKQYYNLRELLDDTGMVIKGSYTDGVERDITEYTLSGFNALQTGEQTITVAVGAFTDTFTVTVGNTRTLSAVALTQAPTKTTYYIGDNLSTAGLRLELTYDDGFTAATASGFTVSGYDAAMVGEQTITVAYEGFTVAYTVMVLTPTVTLSYAQRAMQVGERFALVAGSVPGGRAVEWSTSDSSVVVVEDGLLHAVAAGSATITATITYNGKCYTNTCIVTVEMSPVELVDIAIGALPGKLAYAYGEALDTTGLILRLTYSDGTVTEVADGFAVSGYNPHISGYQTVTVTYSSFVVTFTITVEPPVLDEHSPTFVVSSGMAYGGDTVDVIVSTKNNSGIVSLKLWLEYDSSVLELVAMQGGDFADVTFGPVGACPIAINWMNTLLPNNTTNGIVAVLTFKVAENATPGDTVLTLRYDAEDVYDYDFHNVPFAVENGTYIIADFCPGDINGDTLVNNKDAGLLVRYLSNWGVVIDELAADVDRNGKVNLLDLAILQRYLNGWDVELL